MNEQTATGQVKINVEFGDSNEDSFSLVPLRESFARLQKRNRIKTNGPQFGRLLKFDDNDTVKVAV